ncbi:teicoplanin resistance protein VanJ [Fodinicola feengrottensis]|uniref:Teicoplanin resistance protein VanJ n=1 Tax=Fodinicola feengrottensis TaxID=435914 RepID=A0ABN2FZT5_9ACTN
MLPVLAVAVAGVLVGHQLIPDKAGLSTILESMLPWVGLVIPLLAVIGLLARARAGFVALLVPVVAWAVLFGPAVLPKNSAGSAELAVVSQNIDAGNPNPCAAVTALAAQQADVVAIEELTGDASSCAANILNPRYSYRTSSSSVAVWSRFPLRQTQPLQLGLDWARALRTEIVTPQGNVAVYVVHLPSARPDDTAQRNRGLTELAGLLHDDSAQRVLVVGDLNTATTDREFGVFSGFQDTQQAAGTGFGFTWPSVFPVTRPDHMLFRGMSALSAGTLAANGSDHLGITASLHLS